ncbi:transposase, partial [Faecalitalea cylindroides]|uniref:transposase n=1 Tax=Faecalitalea cylindroides TaxID=39483 RepID=UPI003AB30374
MPTFDVVTFVHVSKCLIHIQRNICAKVRVSDRKEVANEFKEVYRSKSKEEALTSLKKF